MLRKLLTLAVLVSPPLYANGAHTYVVLANIRDTKLVLMDGYDVTRIVEAQLFCYDFRGFDKGDRVFATDNLDACATSTLVSERTGSTCKVWCP